MKLVWTRSTKTFNTHPHRFYLWKPCFKPRHVCAVKPEVLISWSLEIDYSRAPCLGADQKTSGLWERDCFRSNHLGHAHRCRLRSETGWAESGYFLCYFKMVAPRVSSFFDRWSRGTNTLGTRLLRDWKI